MSLPAALHKEAVMMEDHDKAYLAWKERNVADRILVHIDAHIIDSGTYVGKTAVSMPLLNPYLKPRKKMVNIGNYICPAMMEGMVKKFYWVVPDKSWQTARGRRHISRQLRHILKVRKYGAGSLEVRRDNIRCRIFDRELIVTTLEKLELINEPVLLDIDVDFMLTPHIWDDLNPRRKPWIFPEELYEKACPRIKNIDVLTIAYSVEGGFTPLRFKYLGDELRLLFDRGLSSDSRRVMEHKKKALLAESLNDYGRAAAEYERALAVDDSDASAYYNLFLNALSRPLASISQARFFYDRALSRDSAYATVYNNYGIAYLRYNRLKKAQREYKKFMGLDRSKAAVLNGLGHVYLGRGKYAQAAECFDRCLAIDKDYPEALEGKAIAAYHAADLDGAQELFAGLCGKGESDAQIYWWLGCIARKKNDTTAAIDYYKLAVMHGGEGPLVHMMLACLYLVRGFYYRAFEELKRSLSALRAEFPWT
ncbi:MAG: tetratricopeptide repeat protein [Candidatus Omnitrophica bacterium]|nr:tetratricopeptide repeat protein [Candidatus Omnitrophota bacterium]